jgi:hypothetical protein
MIFVCASCTRGIFIVVMSILVDPNRRENIFVGKIVFVYFGVYKLIFVDEIFIIKR